MNVEAITDEQRTLLSCSVNANLATIAALTPMQVNTLCVGAVEGNWLAVGLRIPFDLPQGWIEGEITYHRGGQMYFGISPEGEMST